MTALNPILPNPCTVDFYLNATRGSNPTKMTLTAPRCLVDQVIVGTSEETGAARMTLHYGFGNLGDFTVDGWLTDADDLYDFIQKVRGCWVVIKANTNAAPSNTSVGTAGTTEAILEWAPIDSAVTGAISGSGDPKVIFVGYVYDVQHEPGNLSGTLEVSCVDIPGWMDIRHFAYYPSLNAAGDMQLMHFDNVPDYNEIADGDYMTPNRADEDCHIEIPTAGFNPELSVMAFSANGVANMSGAYWSHFHILDSVIDYINTYEGRIWAGVANITIDWQDHTTKLGQIKEHIKSHQSLWKIICECCDMERGLLTWWTYAADDDGDIACTLHVGFQNNATYNGFAGLDTIDYTKEAGMPVEHYEGVPSINYVDNDRYYSVRANTQPCTFIYTFPISGSFLEGWDGVEPTDEEIDNGGTASHWYQRFIFNPDVLPKIRDYGLTATTLAAESWTPSATHVGVRMISSSQPDMIDQSASSSPLLMPYGQTIELANLPDITGGHTPMEHILFFKNAEDDLEVVKDVTVKFGPGNIVQFLGDESFRDDMKDPETRKNYFITMAVKGTPPLTAELTRPNPTNESSVADIAYKYPPIFVMPNTVISIDEDGAPIFMKPSATAPIMVSSTVQEAYTFGELYDMLHVYAYTFIRPKNKVTWTIDHIDLRNDLLGKWITTMDIPAISPRLPGSPAGGDVAGVGYQEWVTRLVNTVVTKIVYDFANGRTTYYTEFKTWRGRNNGK
jgi:hypothetical protein